MPPIRSARNRKPPPDGFDDIEDTLLEFSNKMKDAENASHEGKKRHEVLWPVFQISHQRKYPYHVSDAFAVYGPSLRGAQGQNTSTIFIMKRKPYQNHSTIIFSKMAMRMGT